MVRALIENSKENTSPSTCQDEGDRFGERLRQGRRRIDLPIVHIDTTAYVCSGYTAQYLWKRGFVRACSTYFRAL